MNVTTRKTCACTLDTLDEELKAAIRAHGAKYGLGDIEADILMCCETISVLQKKGLFGGIQTTLSAVYVTPHVTSDFSFWCVHLCPTNRQRKAFTFRTGTTTH